MADKKVSVGTSAHLNKTITVRMPPEFLARIDGHRGSVPRETYIREVLAAHMDAGAEPLIGYAGAPTYGPNEDERTASLNARVAAKAQSHQPGPNVEHIRSTSQAKRGIEPRPKKGK